MNVPREYNDIDPNDVDPVVNANALFLYLLMGKNLQAVMNYLISIIKGIALNHTPFRSSYYISLPAFLYAISKAITLCKKTPLGSTDTMELLAKKLLLMGPTVIFI